MKTRTNGLFLSALGALLLVVTGCDDASCGNDDDCYSGEYCDDSGECVSGTRPTVNTNSQNGTANATNAANSSNSINSTNSTNSTNSVNSTNSTNSVNSSNSANSANATNSTNNVVPACIVDLIGHSCDDDEHEDNDRADNETMPTDQQAWCVDGELAMPLQEFSGVLCAGDNVDMFRLQIDNRTPHACLAPTFTFRITVNLDVDCAEELVDIRPYTFFQDPVRYDLCKDDDNVRCTVENGGRTHVIDWLWDADQLVDPRLLIQTTQRDVEFGYTVQAEIIQ